MLESPGEGEDNDEDHDHEPDPDRRHQRTDPANPQIAQVIYEWNVHTLLPHVPERLGDPEP